MVTLTHRQPRILIGPRTKMALAEVIEDLQAQRKKTHDSYKRAEIDKRIKALLMLLMSVVMMAFAMASSAGEQSFGVVGHAPCGPYQSSRTCLIAIRNAANECVTARFHNVVVPSPAQNLECIRAALDKFAPNGCLTKFPPATA